jgi:hypothetical protein
MSSLLPTHQGRSVRLRQSGKKWRSGVAVSARAPAVCTVGEQPVTIAALLPRLMETRTRRGSHILQFQVDRLPRDDGTRDVPDSAGVVFRLEGTDEARLLGSDMFEAFQHEGVVGVDVSVDPDLDGT